MEYGIKDITEYLKFGINIDDFLSLLDVLTEEKFSFGTPHHTNISENFAVWLGKDVFDYLYLAICSNSSFGRDFNKKLNEIEIFDIRFFFDEELEANEVLIHC